MPKNVICIIIATFLLFPPAFADEADEYFARGHRFYLETKSNQAEAEFKQALQIDPTLSDAHYYLSSIYFKQAKYQRAIEQTKQALEINPQDLKSLIIQGVCFQQLGQYQQAIDTLQKAVAVDPQSPAVRSALGLVYCTSGDLNKAKSEQQILQQIDAELATDLQEQITVCE